MGSLVAVQTIIIMVMVKPHAAGEVVKGGEGHIGSMICFEAKLIAPEGQSWRFEVDFEVTPWASGQRHRREPRASRVVSSSQ
ncbi:hypothetical protein F5Y17DRAFT_435476 [Xylariaceae sp. FL0594]|nr:hypothetical protein F5Y17DRAFT_435476 [Xylariaceae sp. FL0594]